jgi:hypothetical protein
MAAASLGPVSGSRWSSAKVAWLRSMEWSGGSSFASAAALNESETKISILSRDVDNQE